MDVGICEVVGSAPKMQSEHLGTGSFFWQWDINALFKPEEPSTKQEMKANHRMELKEGVAWRSNEMHFQASVAGTIALKELAS